MGPYLCPLKRIFRAIPAQPGIWKAQRTGSLAQGHRGHYPLWPASATDRASPRLRKISPSIGQRDVDTIGSAQPGEVPSSSTETESSPQHVCSWCCLHRVLVLVMSCATVHTGIFTCPGVCVHGRESQGWEWGSIYLHLCT